MMRLTRKRSIATALGLSAVLGIASLCYAANYSIFGILGISTDPVTLAGIDTTGTTGGPTSLSSFSFVLVNVPARLYVVTANGLVDNDSDPNRTVVLQKDVTQGGYAQIAADALAAFLGTTLTSLPPGNSLYVVLRDFDTAVDPEEGGDSLAVFVAAGRFGTAPPSFRSR